MLVVRLVKKMILTLIPQRRRQHQFVRRLRRHQQRPNIQLLISDYLLNYILMYLMF
jgi:hypothetical protein